MPRIALTGGIASGKTLVSEELARLGAVIVDSDLIAREVVEPGTPGLAQVRARFGGGVVRHDGSLDRAALGKLVFSDDAAREDLNAIVHPLVRARATELGAAAAPGAVVVNVIPLLVETAQENDFDAVVVVDVPTEVQVSRLMHRNNLTTEEARARLRAQAPRTDRLEAADWVIDNSGDEAATIARVRRLWDGPVQGLRQRELARRNFFALPAAVRGPEPSTDVRALRAFIKAQQFATGDDEFDLDSLEELLPGARVLRHRGAIVGAVVAAPGGDGILVHGPWIVPRLRESARPVLIDAALAQAPHRD
ncbi:hypothetical protein GCM10028820_32170 [Tessaracoccus terricola]